jgi:hypothetical protein
MFTKSPDYEEIERLREQRKAEQRYRQEMRWFGEDIGLIPEEEYKPEPKKFDPNDTSKQNFMIGLLAGAPTSDGATHGTQQEIDDFLEQQAVLQEQAMERDIRSGLYQGSPLARMTQAQRQEMYRQNAIDREQARWERDQEAKQRAKRREQRRKELGL